MAISRASMGTQIGRGGMPLNAKGKKIKKAMEKEYGKAKGDRIFYAAENKGIIKGVAKKKPTKRGKR